MPSHEPASPVSPVPVPGDLPPPMPSTEAVRLHRRLSQISAAMVILVAVLVLIGWAVESELLKSLLHPARIAMNPLTAVTFLLAGTAAMRLAAVGRPPRRIAIDMLSGAVLAVGLVQIGSAARLPLALDQVLFRGQLDGNVMAPNTAIAFALIGAALLLVDRRVRGYRCTAWLTISAFAVALLALLGYAYNVSPLYKLHGFIAMALNTAICFYALALSILAARPTHPPISTLLSDSVGGLILRRLLPAAIIMPALVGFAALSVVRRGGFDAELAVLIFTLTTIVVFVALTSWTADRLHKLDLANRRTVDRLQRAEAIYHSLVETLPQNIFRKDSAGRFTFGNRNFCQTLGRPLEQIVGSTDFDFYGPELAARYRHDDLEVTRRGTPMDVVEEHITPAGDRLYVQVIKTPVLGPDGLVIGVQGIFWDVTDRVVAQRSLEEKNVALQQANQQLERAVAAERAAIEELRKTQTHLVQSEKMVGLGQMVAGVAHEINNPLAFVSNNVAVLQRDTQSLGQIIDLFRQGEDAIRAAYPDLAAEIVDLAETIDLDYTRKNLDELLVRSREGLRRIQQIVRDLRDFVRLDESDLQDVDLNAGVSSTINIISGHAKKKQIQIDTDLGVLPAVTCYPAKVNQVIMNLLSNAIDASRGSGRVRVTTRATDGGTSICLSVAGEGTGIAADVRERIFDPFFTTKPVGQGTGLGLSISFGIVRDHGGTIEVDSEDGKGTTFRVILPVKGPAKADDASPGLADDSSRT